MVTQRSEQRCRRSRASRHFSSWSVHGRVSFRRRKSERRRKVFLRKAKRYNGQKCSAHPATRLGVYEGENTSPVFKLLIVCSDTKFCGFLNAFHNLNCGGMFGSKMVFVFLMFFQDAEQILCLIYALNIDEHAPL